MALARRREAFVKLDLGGPTKLESSLAYRQLADADIARP
jgi:hypothetical protein